MSWRKKIAEWLYPEWEHKYAMDLAKERFELSNQKGYEERLYQKACDSVRAYQNESYKAGYNAHKKEIAESLKAKGRYYDPLQKKYVDGFEALHKPKRKYTKKAKA